jgi:acetate kinase
MRVLVVNAGSTSLKLALLAEDDTIVEQRELDAPLARIDEAPLRKALAEGLDQADAVGHRIMHGGPDFADPTPIDAHVEATLSELIDRAPLHQSKALAAHAVLARVLRRAPQIACFDTAFHRTLPAHATTYALPAGWSERWGIRRYGFHGLSHGWVARHTPELLEESGCELAESERELRIISCHLGSGASLCAIRDGQSIDTTMGFTPMEGLVMATRSGSIDPGLMLWLMERVALTKRELAQALEQRSGLQGMTGSGDMREVLALADSGVQSAILARDLYVHRLRSAIGAMAASLGGVDVLAFTGGVGEHSARIRARATETLGFLGVELDPALNQRADGDLDISAPASAARTLVITAREDLEIARQVRGVLVGAKA